jgi:hypothetical protein
LRRFDGVGGFVVMLLGWWLAEKCSLTRPECRGLNFFLLCFLLLDDNPSFICTIGIKENNAENHGMHISFTIEEGYIKRGVPKRRVNNKNKRDKKKKATLQLSYPLDHLLLDRRV